MDRPAPQCHQSPHWLVADAFADPGYDSAFARQNDWKGPVATEDAQRINPNCFQSWRWPPGQTTDPNKTTPSFVRTQQPKPRHDLLSSSSDLSRLDFRG